MDFERGGVTASDAAAIGAAVLGTFPTDREMPFDVEEIGDLVAVGFGGFPLPGAGSVASVVAGLEPGPAAITLLAGLDLAALDEAARVVVLRAWEAQAAWVAAATQPVLAAVAGPEPGDVNEEDWGACEVAAALHLSPLTAQRRVDTARVLTSQLTDTLAALQAGRVTARHAAILVEETTGLPAPLARAVEAKVLPNAPQQTLAQFGRAVRKAVLASRPEQAELAREQARAERRVWVSPEPDGMATLGALLPAEQAIAIYHLVDDLAHHNQGVVDCHGLRLTADQRRADALALLVLGQAPAEPGNPGEPSDRGIPGDRAHPGDRGDDGDRGIPSDRGNPSDDPARRRAARPRVPVELQIVIDLPTLLGLADHPAHLPGYGPLPAGLARDLATDATWRRLITDPRTGHLLDYARTTYRPPKPLADFVRARDRRCRFPGCHQPAQRCDIDHGLPYHQGGPTCPANCACLCRHHHRLKTHAGWKLNISHDGIYTWTSPTGQQYRSHPYNYNDTS